MTDHKPVSKTQASKSLHAEIISIHCKVITLCQKAKKLGLMQVFHALDMLEADLEATRATLRRIVLHRMEEGA